MLFKGEGKISLFARAKRKNKARHDYLQVQIGQLQD